MRPILLAIFGLTAVAAVGPAAEPSEILRFVPRQAELVVVVDHPRALVDTLSGLAPLRELFALEGLKEELTSTNARRFFQLVKYFEKSLDRRWPELIDDLAGGGVAVAMRFEKVHPPAMLVIKAKDETILNRAFAQLIEIVKGELERTESKEKIETHTYRGFTGYKLGPGAFAAIAGPMLFISNKAEAVKAGVDLYVNGAGESIAHSGMTDMAKAMLQGTPLAWSFLNLDRIHALAASQEAYRYPRGDPGALVFAQGITDVIGKSPFVVLGHYISHDGLRTSIRMPRGREATPDGLALHLPPEGKAGSLPLLEPKNTLFSMSYYLDLGKLWTERERLLAEPVRKEIEDGEKKIGRFLGGRKLSEMLTSIGTYHRVVVVAPHQNDYKVKPAQPQPAFAVVTDMRDPKFAQGMNAILRATALIAGLQFKLKLTEETVGAVTLACYRFPEAAKVDGDPGNVRFNFSPCFARVGDQFMAASTVELGRELIAQLGQPAAEPSAKTSRIRVDADGVAELLNAFEANVITGIILDRAISVAQAKQEATAFLNWVRRMGTLDIEVDYGTNNFSWDFVLRWK